MKYTQGSWNSKGHMELGTTPIGNGFQTVITNKNIGIVAIANGLTREEAEANARLIAAAPLLLSALEGALNNVNGNGDVHLNKGGKVLAEIRAAIYSATEQQ